jgi:predicted aspartyl protease
MPLLRRLGAICLAALLTHALPPRLFAADLSAAAVGSAAEAVLAAHGGIVGERKSVKGVPGTSNSPSTAKPLASFAVGKHGDLLVVPIHIGDREILCLVDTGATHNFFDTELQPILGAPVDTAVLAMSSGDRTIPVYQAPAARLGGIELSREDPVACLDLSAWRKRMGVDLRGVIGMAALKRHVVRVDFDRGALEILEPGTEEPMSRGRPVALRTDSNGLRCFATLSVGGAECEFLVDTGATMVTIDQSTANRLLQRSEAHYMAQAESLEFDGKHVSRVYGLREMKQGPYTHQRLALWQDEDHKLGLSFFSCYQVVFDFPKRVMYLQPGDRFGGDERIDTAGLEIDKRKEGMVVAYVWNSGSAGRAGLRSGDRLVKVGDREASSYELYELRHLFDSADQTPIPITYSRSGRLRQTTLVVDDPTIGTTASRPSVSQPTATRPTVTRTAAPVRRFFRR